MIKTKKISIVLTVLAVQIGAEPILAQNLDAGPEGSGSGAGVTESEADGEESGDWSEDWGDSGEKGELPVDIHGSFENQVTGMVPRDARLVLTDSLRLRVDLDADLTKGIKLRSDVVARLFVGETAIPLSDIVPARTLGDLIDRDPRWQTVLEDSYRLENEVYLDNVYLKIPIKNGLVILGKQPLEQGAGYAWNPTDVFTEKDMFDPTYEKEGVVALRAIIPLGGIASLDLVGAPSGGFKKWTAGGRASLRLGVLSVSAVSYITRAQKTDLEGSMDSMMAAELMGEDPNDAILKVDAERVMVGGDVVADIEGVRLWAEGAYNFIENKVGASDDWFEIAGGVEYYFPSETHFMMEYYHYGLGPSQSGGTYMFNDWMGLLAMDLKMLGRDFLFESIDHPIADFWTVGISSFQSLNDASAAVMADVRFAFAEDMELWLLTSITAGEPQDFLSSARAQGWLRLTAFF